MEAGSVPNTSFQSTKAAGLFVLQININSGCDGEENNNNSEENVEDYHNITL